MSTTIDFGIDLGTTNSCIARCETGGPRIFQSNDQMSVTPSAVYITRGGRRIVGLHALSALRTDPENVATGFKRWMGQKDRHAFPASKLSLSAEELSAEVLKSLREDVRRQAGIDLTSAVITVPAAFGTLQCEATARAAQLAGILEAPLLQEPVAAAIGYGVGPDKANQRWLVFDLGGGTLDIAIVSTRDGRLHVLEHIGNNLRGGKDVDQLIVDGLLLPAIAQQFAIASVRSDGKAHLLFHKLRLQAERAKIALSADTRVSVSLVDLGVDDAGKAMELDVEVTRERVESLMEPFVVECVTLAKAALKAARISGTDLDRILLVGGPTQTPLIRSRLAAELGAPVDFSVDPMTVVARGAAMYAATLLRENTAVQVPALPGIAIKLAYEPVCADLSCAVAGRVASTAPGLEIRFEAEGGFWTSGWLSLKGDFFETNLQLRGDEVTTFAISLRDAQGRTLDTDITQFKVRHGLVPSPALLPHSISVEILDAAGKVSLDVVFPKGTPLPAERTVKYRTARALSAGRSDRNIYIKFWEGEFLDAPDANEPISNVELSHDGLSRRLPQGSEVELTIKINSSRLIQVAAYVPFLNEHFSNSVYYPQRDEVVFGNLAAEVPDELKDYAEDLQELAEDAPGDPAVQEEIQEIRSKLMDLEFRTSFSARQTYVNDPDEAKRIVFDARTTYGLLLRLRYRIGRNAGTLEPVEALARVQRATEVVEEHGNAIEKRQLAILHQELERAGDRPDDRLMKRIAIEFEKLHSRVLVHQEWFWRDWFNALKEPGQSFMDGREAKRLIAAGEAAVGANDLKALQDVVRSLWSLQPPDRQIVETDRAAATLLAANSPNYIN